MINRKKRTPTNLEILREIHESYYDEFASYNKATPTSSSKIYVPIDVDRIANRLGVDGDIVFGRLYYHLENRYGYEQSNGSNVHFFGLKVGKDTHCVNFPYLASVLADLADKEERYTTATAIAVLSLVIAILSLTFSILA